MIASWSGDFGVAASLIAEANAVCEVTGSRIPAYVALLLPCLRGSEAEAVPMIDAMINAAEVGGHGIAVTASDSGASGRPRETAAMSGWQTD